MPTYTEYLLLNKAATPPPPDPHASGVRVYADTDGTLHTLQADGTDAEVGSGGGGSMPISGFAAHEDGEFPISNSGTWIPDTVDYLSDDWTNQGDGHFLVATEALYHVECGLVLVIDSGGPADEVWADIAINETAWNVDPISFDLVETPNAISADTWRGYGSAVLPLGPDCLVSVVVSRHPYTAMTTHIAEVSFLRAFKIGVLA